MNQEAKKDNIEENEIKERELFYTIYVFIKFLWKNKLFIGMTSLIFALFFFYLKFKDDKEYTSVLTFIVNEDESSKLGSTSAMAMLGRFGLGGGGKFNLDKILEISHSRKIAEEALFNKIRLRGKEDFFANFLIDMYDLVDEMTQVKDFKFTHHDVSKFNGRENEMLQIVYGIMAKDKGIYNSSYDEDSGIMTMKITTKNDTISAELNKIIFEVLSDYYIKNSIEKDLKIYKKLKYKVDSIYVSMNGRVRTIASEEDHILGSWQQSTKANVAIKSRDNTFSNIIFSEALKNLEMTSFSLQTKTPFIQTIDLPITPIKPNSRGVVKSTIIGLFIGFGLSLILLYILNQVLKYKSEF